MNLKTVEDVSLAPLQLYNNSQMADSCAYLLPDRAAAGELTALLDLVKACSKPSKNEKNTSTAYPTRKAIARGEIDAPCVHMKLNSPTTAPPRSWPSRYR